MDILKRQTLCISVCMRYSIAARKARVSHRATAGRSTTFARMGHVADIFTPDVLNQLPGNTRNRAYAAIQQPATPSFETPSLFRWPAAKVR